MKKERFLGICKFLNDDGVQARNKLIVLRSEFENHYGRYFSSMKILSSDDAIGRAAGVVRRALRSIENYIELNRFSPGHGIGHLGVDYLHSLILARNIDMDPKHLYVGLVAGVLHDILGCMVVDRYQENFRAVRHAEAGALFFCELASEIGVSYEESVLIAYSIAGHTHYINTAMTKCHDGAIFENKPYLDTVDGVPIMCVWFPRWVDRLDICSPRFVGRYFLTLGDEHLDFSNGRFYDVKFDAHMRPLLRNVAEIDRDEFGMTMRERLRMFAITQNNESVYGRFDPGFMQGIRDRYKNQMYRIIGAFDVPSDFCDSFPDHEEQERNLLNQWTDWLTKKVEPSEPCRIAAKKVREKFAGLPAENKLAWFGAMSATLEEYSIWSRHIGCLASSLDGDDLSLPIIGDLRRLF